MDVMFYAKLLKPQIVEVLFEFLFVISFYA